MKKFFLFSILVSMIFISCKKSSNTTSCSLSSSSIVGNYKITSYMMTSGGQTMDMFSDTNYTPLCSRDNIYTISANGIFTESEGAVSCNPPSTSGNTGNWSLNGNTFSFVDSASTAFPYTVSDFSCTSFKLNLADSTTSVSITMTRQ